ncbi:DUF1631 family protein [Lautropia mirabilis]
MAGKTSRRPAVGRCRSNRRRAADFCSQTGILPASKSLKACPGASCANHRYRHRCQPPAILREIRQPILIALNRSIRNAYVAVVDGLIERIVEETNWEKQDQLNVALDILRNGKASIEQQFEVGCARSWKERTGVAPDGSYSTPETTVVQDEPPTLRLVDDDTMRDQLLVARISARARRRMDEELADGLRARFGALLQQDWFAENEYPIAPDIIFEVLRGILTQHRCGPVTARRRSCWTCSSPSSRSS